MKAIGKKSFKNASALWAAALAVSLCAGCSNDREMSDDTPEGFRPVTPSSSKWIDRVTEYRPAPGQFINNPFWATPAAASSIEGGEGAVSLGSYGGYIVFTFDHTVPDREGSDFVIKGNAADGSSEPGAVMVSFDANGNGVADDAWYHLAGGDHFLAGTVRDYSITYLKPSQTGSAEGIAWTDNRGGEGTTASMAGYDHTQSYWPAFAAGTSQEMTFSGIRLQNRLTHLPNGDHYLGAAGRGYADNFSADYTDAVNGDPETAYSNKFDIADAVDADGNKVSLGGADFIKVYTCTNQFSPVIGEASTEIMGAISLAAGR